MKRSLLLTFGSVFLVAGGFVWGFLANKDGIFPFSLLRSIARQIRIEPAAPVDVRANPAILDLLNALPYTEGTFDPDSASRGVITHDASRAYQGVNLYTAYRSGSALLLDMAGNVIYEWTLPTPKFAHAQLFPNGDLMALRRGEVVRIDKDSKVLWSFKAPSHHHFWVDESGRTLVLVFRQRRVPEIHPDLDVLDDVIVTLSDDGEKLDETSLVDTVLTSSFAYLLPSVSHREFEIDGAKTGEIGLDILHTNHVEVLDGRFAARSDVFDRGNLLVSMRNIHAVAILEGETKEIVWLWGPGNVTFQHHPVLLDNGHMLIFNNGTESSQVLELDPLSRDIVWLYEDPGEFFTRTRGSNQRLPNGNTLITESNAGYVFQVSPEGEIVWEFANPDVDEKGVRTQIWRMTLMDREELTFLIYTNTGS